MIRTLDLLDAIEARSQLRHGPTGLRIKPSTFPVTPGRAPNCATAPPENFMFIASAALEGQTGPGNPGAGIWYLREQRSARRCLR